MRRHPAVLIFGFCLATASIAFAEERPAETILKEYAAAQMPKYDPSKTDDESVQAFRKAANKVLDLRGKLALELFRSHPDHEQVPKLLIARWQVVMMNPQIAPQVAAEVVEALPHIKDEKQAREASYIRAIATIVANQSTPEAALPVVDEFIRQDPKDGRGAFLLNGLAGQTENPALKSKLEKRMAAEFPDSPVVKAAEAKRALLEQVGKPFDLAFDDAVKGAPVSIKGLKGKVVVIDFWATWCGPCIAEMPKMKELYAQYKDQGVEFIGVSLDSPKSEGGLDRLKAFVEKNEIGWPQNYLGGAWDSPLITKLGIDSIPRVFLVDAEGNLASVEARGKLETLIPEYVAKAKTSLGSR
ncbi:MAG: redoxin domain-containing protein [Isosphaeraceae bacterium]|nr:redoxin domain-containing protein [Isosphaeraceae bacterium]